MKIVNFADTPSLVSQYMSELRDTGVQRDPLRFRRNLERIGEIMAYEISKTMRFRTVPVETPLATAQCQVIDEKVVLGTIFRAGVPFHKGFLDYFDRAQNAFVSAYRKYNDKDSFDVFIEYIASPRLDGKTLIIPDACDRLFDGAELPRIAHQRRAFTHTRGISDRFAGCNRLYQSQFPGRSHHCVDRSYRS